MEYATEVSKFVAQGACRDFRRADENWRNPTLNAERPTFKKKNRSGTGSFLTLVGWLPFSVYQHISTLLNITWSRR